MKKYIIFCTSIILSILVGYYINFYTSFYIPFLRSNPVSFVTVSDKKIMLNNEEFEIKGVNLSSSIPGYGGSEYKIDKETYLRWFGLIKKMNANTIRVFTIQNTDFYEALYEFNTTNKSPLYLIQGVELNNYSVNSSVDAFDDSILSTMIVDCKKMVDVIHGNRAIFYNTKYASGFYNYDVSEWTLAYILGNNFEPSLIAYTNDINEDKTDYHGKYLYTTEKASPFERVLAEIGDQVLSYESNRYNSQRLISYELDSLIDPLNYSDEIIDYFNKYAEIDLNHIMTTDKVVSGMFAGYEAYTGYPEYFAFSLEKYDDTYYQYVKKLNAHHDIPVVITNVGFSTSRGISNLDFSDNYKSGNITEEEQGDYLENVIKTIEKSGCSGTIIYEWFDDWNNNSWNTIHSVDTTSTQYWHDVQASSQGYGILTFDSVDVKYQDGIIDEWYDSNLISDDGDFQLYGDFDEKYIYLMIKTDEKRSYSFKNFYIGLDITNKSGSTVLNNSLVSFSRPIDFYVKFNGIKDSEVFVHNRYNVLRAVYQEKIDGSNPYENIPEIDTNVFVPIELITNTQKFKFIDGVYQVEDRATLVNTGKLKFGNNNPNSNEYVSNADYFIKDNIVEIRLPWSLLNFADPSKRKIHGDYYENYGVEFVNIKDIYVGVGDRNISLSSMNLSGWDSDVEYTERLKLAYDVMKKVWGENL